MTAEDAWQQLSLLPAGALVITMKVGVVSETQHVQVACDIRDATTDRLLGMVSIHHQSLSTHRPVADYLAEVLGEFWRDHVLPF